MPLAATHAHHSDFASLGTLGTVRHPHEPVMETNSQSTTIVESEDDIPAPSQLSNDTAVCIVSVKGLKENWQKWSDEHQEYQKHNPFSHDTRPSVVVPHKGQDDYGRPLQGSMTEQRGKDAHTHISREVQELCEVIRNIGETTAGVGGGSSSDGKVITVEFGKLFEHYVTISNKLVGILLRARKQRLVNFEGEMLWQGKDDHVVITLLQ
ncbi:hypothetical protein INR49_012830 [Caranx melampygus]|nr:hypothetical protein INR49_012830 [Caranx melampygus]